MYQVTHENLHRTAKYLMDSGRASSHDEAMNALSEFGLYVVTGPEVSSSRDHQIALLTLVNVARRTFLGGVHVVGAPDVPLQVPLTDAGTVKTAVVALGGANVGQRQERWPVAVIGTVDVGMEVFPCWQLTWEGWRGGVVPVRDGRRLEEQRAAGGMAAAAAAAACAAEVFLFHTAEHALAGRRTSGLSLWNPGADWLAEDYSEVDVRLLPSKLWLIGLGNLGQAYLWLLACLPYTDPTEVELVLQDYDRLAPSNVSTSVLTHESLVGRKKTRAVAEWLEARGFQTAIEERRFGAWTRRAEREPGVALCGVDNALARASLEEAGFGLVVEAGLGAGPQGFRNFSLHTFPSSLSAARLWAGSDNARHVDVSSMPAYSRSVNPGLDECGLVQLASRSVGAPFVSLATGTLVVSEVLRRLNGGPAVEVVSGSVNALEDVVTCGMSCDVYGFGHVPVTIPKERTQQMAPS